MATVGRQMRDRTTVVLFGAAVGLLLALSFAGIAWWWYHDHTTDKAASYTHLGRAAARLVEGDLAQAGLAAETLCAWMGAADFAERADWQVDHAPAVAGFHVRGPDDRVVLSGPDEAIRADAATLGLTTAAPGRPGIGRPLGGWGPVAGLLPLARPCPRGGAVVALIRLDRIEMLFADLRPGPATALALYRADGQRLAGVAAERGPKDGGESFAARVPLSGGALRVDVGGGADLAVAFGRLVVTLAAVGGLLVLAIGAVTVALRRQMIDRDDLERLLARRGADLELANEELRQMAELSAHHLQEPLRIVLSYAQLLIRRTPGDDSVSAEYVAFIRTGIERMQGQLEAMRRYLAIERGAERGPVGLARVLAEALGRLRPEIEAAGSRIEAGPMPDVIADRQQMSSLFHHLLASLLARREPGGRQVIEILAERDDGVWHILFTATATTFDIQDGGVVLPLLDAASGGASGGAMGLGPALCRKLIHLNGGRMWAFNTRRGEAHLHFTLPAA